MGDLLTIAQAAERRGCSARAIRAAIADGRLVPYDSPAGERFVWAAEVDALAPARHPNRSSGEPVETVAEVPGDDDAIRKGFDRDERRLMSWALDFASLRGRAHVKDKPVLARLIRRFHRMTTRGGE